MKARAFWIVFLCMSLALVLGACTYPEDGCGPASLIAPEGLEPLLNQINVDTQPRFVWSYPSSCMADEFEVQVTTYGGYDYGTTYTAAQDSGITNYIFPDALTIATRYEWRVRASIDGVWGDYSPSYQFWTTPVCATADLIAPHLASPADGEFVDNEYQPLWWEYADPCLPERWEVQLVLASDPAFSGPNLIAESTTPAIGVIPGVALTDCTAYIWRIRAVNSGGSSPWSETFTFTTDLEGLCAGEEVYPVCHTANLLAPTPLFPDYGAIVELSPSFSWEYPDTCVPEGYRVEITTYGGYGYGTLIAGGTGDASTSWSVGSPLEPATDYEWRVAPINGEDLGPYSTSTRFWTGPICLTADLLAPALISPLDGAVVDNPYPPLDWDYADPCVPEHYEIDLSTDETFAGPSLVADQSTPADAVIPMDALADCTEYFWRVRAQNGDGDGPFSTVFSFTTDFDGTCTPGEAKARAPINTTCRKGDGTIFEPAGYLLAGETALILGQNQGGTWLLIENPDWNGTCWISRPLVEVEGPLELAPVVTSPPTPTPLPTATFTPLPSPTATPVQGCLVTLKDKTQKCVVPCPANAYPGTVCTP